MVSKCLPRSSPEGTQTRRKATLICPTCGHESPARGDSDWAITEVACDGDRHAAYECPVCWTTVVVQPIFSNQ